MCFDGRRSLAELSLVRSDCCLVRVRCLCLRLGVAFERVHQSAGAWAVLSAPCRLTRCHCRRLYRRCLVYSSRLPGRRPARIPHVNLRRRRRHGEGLENDAVVRAVARTAQDGDWIFSNRCPKVYILFRQRIHCCRTPDLPHLNSSMRLVVGGSI